MRFEGCFRYTLAAVAFTAWTGCTVGPDYVRPPAPVPAAYKEGEGWTLAHPADARIGEAWWLLFNDPQLSALVEQVAISNQNLAAAEAQLRQARALARAARAEFYPTLTAAASIARSRRSGGVSSGTGTDPGAGSVNSRGTATDYSLPLELSWEADLWGRIRRNVEANRDSAQASAADLAAARLSAQAELAENYFLLRSLDAERALLDETVSSLQKARELTQNRYATGVAAKADLLQAETLLKTTKAQAISLGVQRAQLEHAIALLIGKPAAAFSLPAAPLAAVLPRIPVGLPSQLLERRPDIASAERRMAAANAQIGIAQAAYYPSVRLSASAGLDALTFADLVSSPGRFWAVGPALAATLFDAGLRRAQSDQARANYEATVAFYRQTVLTGFQEVEDHLAALRILEAEAQAQEDAVRSSREALEVTLNQYRGGIVGYLNVIVSQSTALANERAAVGIRSRRLAASVLLIRALGGGWDAGSLRENGAEAGSHGAMGEARD